ncbi:DUF2461 domain-containing protein [Shimia sp. R9_2]|uniref:DUF2461 domain-containing protein n=1 Tax=Shimia sp. R9_2 TaxID=2821112 RepID=UPI001ADA5FD1|nr:DUF2461 domain-containing protein [Shimia sp. R9_2]MBO9396092.1 DUF2461 domain-containing protein [Shimia sp. R9_2]
MSTAALDGLIPDTRQFLGELAENNTRDWFLAHKETYDKALKAPALELLDKVAAHLQKQTGQVPTTKLFRPNRDVRFSKDKTPYHLHLHMSWSTAPTGWFFGIGQDYISAGAGIMGFDKDMLTRWRAAVDGPKGEEIAAEVDRLLGWGARLDEPALKRVPAPYGKDHPQEALLRRKGLAMWFEVTEEEASKGDLVSEIASAFHTFDPLNRILFEI